MDNKRIFENYLTDHYANSEKTNFKKRDEVLLLLDKNMQPLDYNLKSFFKKNVRKESNILDLGCGYGSFLYFLKSHQYKNVTGVDISSEELDVCKDIFKSYTFYQEDIFEFMHSTKEKFDVIYLSHVLEHIKKDQLFDFLERVKNILQDDGYFIIVAPNSGAYFNAAANRYGDLTHELGFTELSLRQLFMVAKFKHIEIRNFFGVGAFWLNVIRKITLFIFEIFLQVLGYDKQNIYTPSVLTIVRK
ncbi:MAG: class I SAM-dependent methyltransferase [bacterium]|nr:class I SAM-dependent methyltransferase [bacterium]